jgi:signal transduction histidine kinase
LIGNAIKYRRPDELPRVTVSAAYANSEWVISVADNGTGFHPGESERIFQLFTRVKESSDTSGSGIGLAICKRIVERHGGRIWADSVPGHGSTFHFSIPQALVSDAA